MKDSEYASVLFFLFSHRIFVVALCCIGILWVPVLKDLQGGQLFTYIQAVSSYFSPPIAAVYIIAILWKRSNEKGRQDSLRKKRFLTEGFFFNQIWIYLLFDYIESIKLICEAKLLRGSLLIVCYFLLVVRYLLVHVMKV